MVKHTFSKEPRLAEYEAKVEQYSITYTDDETKRTKTLGLFDSEEACLAVYDKLLEALKKIRTLKTEDVNEDQIHVTGTGYSINRNVTDKNGRPQRTAVNFSGVITCVCRDTILNRINNRLLNDLFGTTIR